MTQVYIEKVRPDFWQLARDPDDGDYLDPMGPRDCMTHTAARLVARAREGLAPKGTPGPWPPNGYAIRQACIDPATGKPDKIGGVNHTQVKSAVSRLYGVPLTTYYGNSFDDVVDLSESTHGIGLSIWYRRIRDDLSRRGSTTFYENHEVFLSNVDRKRGVFTDVVDPLADGRQVGLYHGPGEYRITQLRLAAGELNLAPAGKSYRALGTGKAYFIVTAATGAPPAVSGQYHVVFNGTPGHPSTYTKLYASPNGAYVGSVSSNQRGYDCVRLKVDGLWWYKIVAGGSDSTNGRWFKPNRYTEVTPK